jgi:hypothetical protein
MDSKFLRAEELGVRLEIVGGLPIWEPYPVYKHQKAVDQIRATISKVSASSGSDESRSECVHVSDVYISFPDGSLKRPDISVSVANPTKTTNKRSSFFPRR